MTTRVKTTFFYAVGHFDTDTYTQTLMHMIVVKYMQVLINCTLNNL